MAGLAFLITAWGPPGAVVLFNYLALIICCGCIAGWLAWRWWGRPLFYAIAGPAVLVPLLIHAATDRYTTTWTKVWDEEKYEFIQTLEPISILDIQADTWIRIEDTYKRWPKRIVYRRIEIYEPERFTPEVTREGPMTETTKPHGKWTIKIRKPPFQTEYEWHWYGEVISEGEWHLRNK